MAKYGIFFVLVIFSGTALSLTIGRNKRQVSFPGTKWCGPGTTATSYDDLGRFSEADMCCRAHDNCPDGIGPKQEKYGLYNDRRIYISLCSCDAELYSCLKNNTDPISNTIGAAFFNVLDMKCIDQVYPQVCVRRGFFGRCLKYAEDTGAEKVWAFQENDRFYINRF